MAITFFTVVLLASFNDIIAFMFSISLNVTTWMGRIGVLTAPPLAWYVAYRVCVGLQRSDRQVLEHGVETGIVRRLPHGAFVEVHQPLGPVDEHGHPEEMPYQGAPVPKRMNKLGAAGHPVPGSLLVPDPREETVELERAAREQPAIELGERADESASRRGSSP
jgi:ubiquinol-cytochrome c reductase cytochrome b subunit